MKMRLVFASIGALAAVALVAAACGDGNGGDDASGIRTEQGLSVAARAADLQAVDETAEETGAAPAPAAPQADAAIGAIAPEFAPLPFAASQHSLDGVTVQGFGSASIEADSAVLELFFSGTFPDDVVPLPEPGFGQTEPGFEGEGPAERSFEDIDELEETLRQEIQPIAEDDLQPVVDAIVAQGVSRENVQVTVEPYGATIRVTVSDVGALDRIMDAATQAALSLEEVSFNGSNIAYTVDDCAALELAAMQAAVDDARERGETFADALGVGLGAVEGASHTSYSAFGSPCDSRFGEPYPLDGVAFAEGQTPEVELVTTVAITFAIR